MRVFLCLSYVLFGTSSHSRSPNSPRSTVKSSYSFSQIQHCPLRSGNARMQFDIMSIRSSILLVDLEFWWDLVAVSMSVLVISMVGFYNILTQDKMAIYN